MATVLDRLAPAGRRVASARRGRRAADVIDQTVGVAIDDLTVTYRGVDGHVDAVAGVDLRIPAGSTTVLLGPSGCGKTSLLRAIAGLERPAAGTVTIGDRVVSDIAGGKQRAWVRPERRGVGMVFQDGALFPHLTVAENIAFGLHNRRGAADRVAELLDLVDLPGLGDRLPDTLSGGQQQRVALARSLAPNPSILLLDEPFSALDAGLRVQVRSEVARILREVGVTSVFVTHDQDEAFVLGDGVAVMNQGRIEQYGAPAELYRTPANRWVAEFVGEANALRGPVHDAAVDTVIGPVPLADSADERDATVIVRPEQVEIRDAELPGVAARVRAVEYYGHDVRYELDLDGGDSVVARTTPHVLLDEGTAVSVRYQGPAATSCPDR